jgi:hypothetical protein
MCGRNGDTLFVLPVLIIGGCITALKIKKYRGSTLYKILVAEYSSEC